MVPPRVLCLHRLDRPQRAHLPPHGDIPVSTLELHLAGVEGRLLRQLHLLERSRPDLHCGRLQHRAGLGHLDNAGSAAHQAPRLHAQTVPDPLHVQPRLLRPVDELHPPRLHRPFRRQLEPHVGLQRPADLVWVGARRLHDCHQPARHQCPAVTRDARYLWRIADYQRRWFWPYGI